MFYYERIISSLLSRHKEGILTIQEEGGESVETFCTFAPPTTLEEIRKACQLKNWNMPDDYVQFLLTSNGARIYDVVRTYGGIHLFSIEEALENHYDYMPRDWIPVANLQGDLLLIDSSKYLDGDYLFYRDFGEVIEKQSFTFNITFFQWFERIILTQGSRFWNWAN